MTHARSDARLVAQTSPSHRGARSSAASVLAIDAAWRRRWIGRLLRWFDAHARDLPWRRTRDLYAIWVSEIMLQQTQVATVVPYWQRFLQRFPDVASLAAADEQEVLRYWEGLGYYRRARLLHAAARQIMERHGGRFPTTFDAVRSLPGIGRYTAGAILSIGLDQRLPVLEANTRRVLCRLAALEGDPNSSPVQAQLWSLAETLLPARRCGDVNQALMELGSTLCTPAQPDCLHCPLAGTCLARECGIADQLPRQVKQKRYETVTELAIAVRRRHEVLLRRCENGERWAGLWDFLRFSWQTEGGRPPTEGLLDRPVPGRSLDLQTASVICRQCHEQTGISIRNLKFLHTLQHGVTRFRITLHCLEAKLAGQLPNGSSALAKGQPAAGSTLRWVPLSELDQVPLSSTGRAIGRLLVQEDGSADSV
jgi:A/G-specific adenine glycosylase